MAYPENASYDPVSIATTGNYAYITSGSASYYNYLLADLRLPDGASVGSITCYFYDTSSTVDIASSAYLFRRGYTSTGGTSVISMALETSGESSSEMRTATGSPGSPLIIDNSMNIYFLRIYWSTGATSSSSARFYGCAVDHSIDRL